MRRPLFWRKRSRHPDLDGGPMTGSRFCPVEAAANQQMSGAANGTNLMDSQSSLTGP